MSKLTSFCVMLAAAALLQSAGVADAAPTPNLVLTCSDSSAVGRAQNECNGRWSYELLTNQLVVLTGSFSAHSWAIAATLTGAAPVAVCTLPVEPGQYSSCRDQAGVRRIAFILKERVFYERATLHVETNGVDGAACGALANPCRTITQAISNARTDDWILVGPGRYGNLNRDTIIGEPGEEGRDHFWCRCLVSVSKRLSILSVSGATETVIDAGYAPSVSDEFEAFDAVRIDVDGVTFGAPGHGFTVTGSGRASGIEVAFATGVRIAGNILRRNAAGIALIGRRNLLTQNLAIGNDGTGFWIFGDGHFVSRNTAIAQGDGFSITGTNHTLLGNVSNGNSSGYTLTQGAGHELRHNSAVGNSLAGIRVAPEVTGTLLQRNNIYGNGEETDIILAPLPHCGVLNLSGTQVDAVQNFWGAASGPGAEPADGVCDSPGLTIYQPFAESRFEIAGAAELTGETDWADVTRFLESNAEAGIAEALALE